MSRTGGANAGATSLNPGQDKSVRWSGGDLLVRAGAGSGKTRVLTRRFHHLATELGVPIEPLQQAMEERLAQIPKVTGGAQPQISQALGRPRIEVACGLVAEQHLGRVHQRRTRRVLRCV